MFPLSNKVDCQRLRFQVTRFRVRIIIKAALRAPIEVLCVTQKAVKINPASTSLNDRPVERTIQRTKISLTEWENTVMTKIRNTQ